jgi:hypothetical protein
MLRREQNRLILIGRKTVRVFKKGTSPVEMGEGDDLSFLL